MRGHAQGYSCDQIPSAAAKERSRSGGSMVMPQSTSTAAPAAPQAANQTQPMRSAWPCPRRSRQKAGTTPRKRLDSRGLPEITTEGPDRSGRRFSRRKQAGPATSKVASPTAALNRTNDPECSPKPDHGRPLRIVLLSNRTLRETTSAISKAMSTAQRAYGKEALFRTFGTLLIGARTVWSSPIAHKQRVEAPVRGIRAITGRTTNADADGWHNYRPRRRPEIRSRPPEYRHCAVARPGSISGSGSPCARAGAEMADRTTTKPNALDSTFTPLDSHFRVQVFIARILRSELN